MRPPHEKADTAPGPTGGRPAAIDASFLKNGGLFAGQFRPESLIKKGSGARLPLNRPLDLTLTRSAGRFSCVLDGETFVEYSVPMKPVRAVFSSVGCRVKTLEFTLGGGRSKP